MALIQKTLHNSAALKVRRRQKGEKCGVPAGDALVHVRAVGLCQACLASLPGCGMRPALAHGLRSAQACLHTRWPVQDVSVSGKGSAAKGIPARAFQQGHSSKAVLHYLTKIEKKPRP